MSRARFIAGLTRTRPDFTCSIVRAVCRKYRVSEAEMRSHRKYAALVAARWEWFAGLRSKGMSYLEIAAETGFDHTTVMHGIKRRAAQ